LRPSEIQLVADMPSSPLMARSSASISTCISTNLLRRAHGSQNRTSRLSCRMSVSSSNSGHPGTTAACPIGVNRVILVVGRLLPVFPWKRTSPRMVGMSQRCQEPTSLMPYSITSSATSSAGGIVTPRAFGALRKLARVFVVSERRRSDRKQCRSNPDRPQHKDGYRTLPTGTACNPKQYWKKT
jgi:hypothetical protein